VHVVEAPRSVEGPSEAPGTARFRTLWTAARAEFDYVVVDTSPLQAASEAPVVARAADASLFVVEEGRTGSRLALAVRRRLETLQVRILGVVVNRSRLRLTSGPDVPRPGPGPVRPDAARTAATSAR
jgi:Mrp family chromosome partitioning ATPase